MEYALVIVDMQPGFLPHMHVRETIQKQVIREIKLAKKANLPIIVLEFHTKKHRELGYTISPIMKLLEGYEKLHLCYKRKVSGADQVLQVVKKYNYPVSNYRVCGVEWGACVYQTAHDLVYEHVRWDKKLKCEGFKIRDRVLSATIVLAATDAPYRRAGLNAVFLSPD